jgi:hypothetical protein
VGEKPGYISHVVWRGEAVQEDERYGPYACLVMDPISPVYWNNLFSRERYWSSRLGLQVPCPSVRLSLLG